MKKIILTSICVFAMGSAIAWNLSQEEKTVSLTDLASNNIEALASGEGGGRCTGPKTNGNCECRNSANCRDMSGC